MTSFPLLFTLAVLLSAPGLERVSVAGPERRAAAETHPLPSLQLTGSDKPRHAAMSFAIVLFGNAGAALAGFDPEAAVLIGVGASAAAGIGKEAYDRAQGSAVDPADLLWNALGIIAGWLLVDRTR